MFKTDSSFNVLYTTDITKTHDFFAGLDLEIKERAEDKVVVVFGSFELHCILASTEPFVEYEYITDPEKYGQGVIFYIETTDILQAEQRISKLGGTIKKSVFENHWGYQELLFEDPNGYKFALYQEL